jgi:alkanesulfonate monooxygenase SsuD/methylene tetrahydromethanopterin reductase-like flavin-dependent oxidoreductase (luciferase family)
MGDATMTIKFVWQLPTQADGQYRIEELPFDDRESIVDSVKSAITTISDVVTDSWGKNTKIHIFNALPPRQLETLIEDLRLFALQQQRDVVMGLRIDVLVRENEEEAIHTARKFLNPANFDFYSPWQAPKFATPFAQYGTGAHSALIGSYDDVSEQILQYIDTGVEVFVLAAVPHNEEVKRFDTHVAPRVRAALSQRAPRRPAFERAISAA